MSGFSTPYKSLNEEEENAWGGSRRGGGGNGGGGSRGGGGGGGGGAAERIIKNIQQISANVNSLTSMVNQLGTKKDTPQFRKRMTTTREKTQKLISSTSGYIKSSKKEIDRKQLEKLANTFNNCVKSYEEVSRVSMRKEREMVKATESKSYPLKTLSKTHHLKKPKEKKRGWREKNIEK
eukprot:TRINITY_DN3994_c0_g1_i1.p1 TRINITY_DN3994_c0_g1~~TRINITY_DN3994_c0_g1_i1.p1  ORF type:complete len:206 (+),score=53.34 TRINITY_DN3994_c0_g1_i1:82-618(+)